MNFNRTLYPDARAPARVPHPDALQVVPHVLHEERREDVEARGQVRDGRLGRCQEAQPPGGAGRERAEGARDARR